MHKVKQFICNKTSEGDSGIKELKSHRNGAAVPWL